MKRYKLLKDLPTIKAGEIFKETVTGYNEKNLLVRIAPLNAKSPRLKVQDIDNFDEWFEEIQEPTDSIHWKPKKGDNYFYIVHSYNPLHNEILVSTWIDDGYDRTHYLLGNIYRSYEEAEKARDRELTEVRLRRTSNFKPDFKNGNGGYSVDYDYIAESLRIYPASWVDAGEPVRYETEEDAQKSIDEHEKEWLAYFGVKKGEQEECRR